MKIKHILKSLGFSFFTLIVISGSCYASDDYSQKLDELMGKFDKAGLFSGVVMLAKDGAPVYEKAFGCADWNNKIPNTTSTLFNIGSINKIFTHAIINQLQNEGKLKTSDKLSQYLKLYNDERDDKITIDMLIDMKAGLNDYLRNPQFNRNIESFKTVDDFLSLIKNEPLLFEPGTGQEYSNSGYVVLGGIIEKVTGKSYADNIKERFLVPLDMRNTVYRQIGDDISSAASGTRILYSGKKISEPFHSMPSPAGGLFMTVGDLLKLDNELRKTGIVKSGIRAGGTPGWNAILAQYDNGYSLIILSNYTRAAEEVEMRFRSIMKGEQYPEPDITMEMKMYDILINNGVEGLKNNLKDLLEKNDMLYRDVHLNMFGYALMEEGETELALKVFTLNTELFPAVPNVWDSLAEAYMKMGNKEMASANYKKVLELDPANENAKNMLDKLK